jgi:hypothetical protein
MEVESHSQSGILVSDSGTEEQISSVSHCGAAGASDDIDDSEHVNSPLWVGYKSRTADPPWSGQPWDLVRPPMTKQQWNRMNRCFTQGRHPCPGCQVVMENGWYNRREHKRKQDGHKCTRKTDDRDGYILHLEATNPNIVSHGRERRLSVRAEPPQGTVTATGQRYALPRDEVWKYSFGTVSDCTL